MSSTAVDPEDATGSAAGEDLAAPDADAPGEAPDPSGPPDAGAPAATGADDASRAPLSWPARALALAGWCVVVIGALGASDHISHFAFAIPWMRLAWWFAYVALFHDLLVVPVVTLVALGVGHLVPRVARAPVAGGLIVSASLAVMSYPRLRGYGAIPGDPSILPGNAAQDLAVVLGVVWLVVAGLVARRVVRARRPSAQH